MPEFQALFDVRLSLDIRVVAADADEAVELFDQYKTDGLDELLARSGCTIYEDIEWDSSLEPLKVKEAE